MKFQETFLTQTTDDVWNTTAITPGTKFMLELNKLVAEHFDNSKSSFSKFKVDTILVSGSNRSGEGEHKLFDYIRIHPEKHLPKRLLFMDSMPTLLCYLLIIFLFAPIFIYLEKHLILFSLLTVLLNLILIIILTFLN